MKILFIEEDLDPKMSQGSRSLYLKNGVDVVDTDTADKMLTSTVPHTVVSYVAAPTDPKNGSYCYKMLIDTQTYSLRYFRKHRISNKFGAGFSDFDLRSISMTR